MEEEEKKEKKRLPRDFLVICQIVGREKNR